MVTRQHPDGEIRFPVIELVGRRDGPTLTVTAGTHGAEYPGIDAAVRLGCEVDPNDLRGTLRLVPVCNVPGFLSRREVVCPIDGENLNRVFPGDPNGSYTVALAAAIFHEAIAGSDFLVDMHGGDIFEALVPYTGTSPASNPEVDARSRELGRVYGLPYLLEFSSLPGASTGMSLAAAARDAGIPAILAEAGGQGVLTNDDSLLHIQGAMNMMFHLGMLDGEPVAAQGVREMRTEFWRIAEEGLVYPTLKLYQHVMPDDPTGVVKDWYGNVVEELRAPREAHVIAIVTTLAARRDAIVYQVAVR